jgi:hypothetical protein
MIKDTPHCPPSLSISFFFPTFPPRLFQNFTYKLPYIYIYIYIYIYGDNHRASRRPRQGLINDNARLLKPLQLLEWCYEVPSGGEKEVDKKLDRSTSHAKGSYRIITLYKIIAWCRFKNE